MRNFNQRGRNDSRGFGGRGSGDRSMHQATCDECGQDCEVPFKPTGGKPIFCSTCFGKNKNSDSPRSGRRDSGRSSYGSNQMFTAVCDKCGKNCEVPFKPTGNKPIFCNDCFGQNRGDGGKSTGPTKDQFEMINSKLDKILMVLNPATKEATRKKSKEIKSEKVAPKKVSSKKVTPKKVAPKKVSKSKATPKKAKVAISGTKKSAKGGSASGGKK